MRTEASAHGSPTPVRAAPLLPLSESFDGGAPTYEPCYENANNKVKIMGPIIPFFFFQGAIDERFTGRPSPDCRRRRDRQRGFDGESSGETQDGIDPQK